MHGAAGSVELIGGRLEVVGGRVDGPDRPAGTLEELDAVGVVLGEDLDDRTLRASREALDVAAQADAVVEPETPSRCGIRAARCQRISASPAASRTATSQLPRVAPARAPSAA